MAQNPYAPHDPRHSEFNIKQILKQQEDAELAKVDARKQALAQAQKSKYQEQLEMVRAGREQDLAAGRARGADVFKEGVMGRLSAERPEEIAQIIAQRKLQTQGMTPEEQEALRSVNVPAIQQQQAGQMRQLAIQQARSGVRGAAAGAQRADIQKSASGQLAQQERDLFLKQQDLKRSALGQYEQSVGSALDRERSGKEFNIAQQNKELAGRLATELGYGQLGAGERASVMQDLLGDKYVDLAEAESKRGK